MVDKGFTEFLDAVAVLFFTEPDSRRMASMAGIDFRRINSKKYFSAGLVAEYLTRVEKGESEVLVAEELRKGLKYFESRVDLTLVPREFGALRAKWEMLSRRASMIDLGESLIDKPEQGEELIRAFSRREPTGFQWATFSDLQNVYLDIAKAKVEAGKILVEIPGFEMLSQMIGGFNPERIGFLMGDTGFGKTNLCLNLALRASEILGVAYANLEMGFEDICRRITAIGGGVKYFDYNRGKFDSHFLKQEFVKFKNGFITDGRKMSIDQIEAWVQFLSEKKKIDILFVDYDQKLDLHFDSSQPEWKALQMAIEELEEFAKQASLYVMVAVQVNREGLISGSHRSQFAAHTILHFVNDEDRGPMIKATKNRHGKKSRAIRVNYDEETSRIMEVQEIGTEFTKERRVVSRPSSSTNNAGKPYKDE